MGITIPAVALLILICGGVAPTALAQSPELDLSRENERLKGRITELEATLDAAMEKINALEVIIESLRKQGNQTSAPPASTVESAIPERSPEGMVEIARMLYGEAVESEAIPAASPSDDAAAIRRVRAIEKWISSTDRDLKQRVKWPVLVTNVEQIDKNLARIELTIWNPRTGSIFGKPFDTYVTPRVVERIRREGLRNEDGPPVFVFEAIFKPGLRYDERRTEAGPFNNPPFIAPGIEMEWKTTFKSLGNYVPDEDGTESEDPSGNDTGAETGSGSGSGSGSGGGVESSE